MAPGFTRYAPTAGPSRWLLIAGRRFVACVESTVPDSVVDAVWWLADSDLATIESVVGAFPLAGPDSVRSFAVAELGEPNAAGEVLVTAVVRGSAAIDVFSVGGSRRFGAGGVQPWVLAEFRTVTGLVLGGDDLPTGPVARLSVGSLPLGLGVVDGELLTWTLSPIERVERSAPRPPQAVASPAVEPSAVAEETIIRGRSHSSSLFGHGAPDTQGEEAPAQPVRPVAHELPGAVDIEPPLASDTPEPVRDRVTAEPFPATEPVILPPPPATFGVRTPQGDILPLDVPVLIGRRPAPPRVDAGVLPRLLTVPSPTQEVSGTHVRIEQSGDAVVVTDLRSTNGTRLLRPGSGPVGLRPGESAVALRGTAVEIGDGNIIEITAVPSGSPSGAAPSSGGDDRRGEGLE
ncbi:FHA domain-containing protein [uncultured Leifsonia sp.]|uniref:FHA domain-containing protein n=1 Tax=uncultured Leifsonia sp. TaxID=340359 RepID=UPI0028D5EFDB|nr:FHA domain-containing protein [uncultured Leifsonia sp.]